MLAPPLPIMLARCKGGEMKAFKRQIFSVILPTSVCESIIGHKQRKAYRPTSLLWISISSS